jgi:hypothetical protein
VPEGQRAQGRRPGERDGLGEVGAHQLPGGQQRVGEQQQDDHQGARADRGHADDQAAGHADGDGGDRPDGDLRDLGRALRPRPAVQDVPEHHRGRSGQQRRPEGDLHVLLVGRAVAQQVQQVGPCERHRHRAERHPADQAQIDRALLQVDGRADGPHHHGGDQVAGDGGGRLHREQQDQHRRHQRAAARSGQSDEQSHHGTAEDDVEAQTHLAFPSHRTNPHVYIPECL